MKSTYSKIDFHNAPQGNNRRESLFNDVERETRRLCKEQAEREHIKSFVKVKCVNKSRRKSDI